MQPDWLLPIASLQVWALTSVTPLTGENWVDNIFRPDHPVVRGQEPAVNVRWIDQDYLPTMQSPLVAGRNITVADRANPYVGLISERTAREAFPGENPIGRTISDLIPDDRHPLTVIGVVADARINGLKDNAAMVYLPYWASGRTSRSAWRRCWTRDNDNRTALGPQSLLSNACHGSVRGGRQRTAAPDCRHDSGDCTGPARCINRPDAGIEDGVGVNHGRPITQGVQQ
jgi:hypothetical protein